MKKIILLLLVLSPLSVFSQDCDCKEIFAWTKQTFEENDAGFAYILENKGKQAYAIHNELIEVKINDTTNPIVCQDIIRDWLAFFRKGHVEFHYIGEFESPSEDSENQESSAEEEEEEPQETAELDELYRKFLNSDDPFLEILNDNTIYLRIPSFAGSEKGKIESLITLHEGQILSTNNLIIDIRYGTGGSDVSFEGLLPILYTNPVRTIGVEFLSTKLNNQRMYELATNTGIALQYGLNPTEEQMKEYQAQYDTLSNHLGEFVSLSAEKVEVTTYDTSYAFPKKIGIIINQNNASTDEQFLLAAKQSMKVKLFGNTTKGALDVSNLNIAYSPEEDFALVYALSKSLRIPELAIDDIGIQPDFFIDEEIDESEWIKFVNDILNR